MKLWKSLKEVLYMESSLPFYGKFLEGFGRLRRICELIFANSLFQPLRELQAIFRFGSTDSNVGTLHTVRSRTKDKTGMIMAKKKKNNDIDVGAALLVLLFLIMAYLY